MTETLRSEVRPIVLVVDDSQPNRELLEANLAELGYDVRQASDGMEALEAVELEEPDLVLLDIDMPRLDGLSVCARLKSHPTQRLIPIVIITAFQERDMRMKGLAAGADDFLTKPFDAKELLIRTRVLLRERVLNKRLDATDSVLRAFARTVEARDMYTIHHADRVGLYSRAIGDALGYGTDDLDLLYDGGVMHDLGKIAIPDAILLKPGPLTEEEHMVIQRHPGEGERICLPLRSTRQFLPVIRHHHERYDGRGYPDHLVGEGIPFGARIAAVADAFDAMVSDRPYRAGLAQDEASARLRSGAGSQWDARIVDSFLALADAGTVQRIRQHQFVEGIAGGVSAQGKLPW